MSDFKKDDEGDNKWTYRKASQIPLEVLQVASDGTACETEPFK